ncbi:MAG: sortase [Candidatus Saccharibacteria bacterium]
MLDWLKKFLYMLAIVLAAVVVLDFGFFRENLEYIFQKPADVAVRYTPTLEREAKTAKDRLLIPALGIDAPILYPTEASEQTFQQHLQNGVVHYPGTAGPGQLGNVYIFGHSSDYLWAKGDYKNVFAVLPRIKVGDRVILTDGNGREFVYKVSETMVAEPTDTSLLGQKDYQDKFLTLQTSYPLGTALKRFIVIAKME